jgi:hypothetical protein
MVIYRMTLRHAHVAGGRAATRYHVVDIEADNIRAAMMQAINAFPPGGEDSGDLVEIRVHVDPEERNYAPE